MKKADTLLSDFIKLHKDAKESLHLQIFLQIKKAIINGDLGSGFLIPPSRKLALELGVSRNTIIVAYDNLKAEGLIESYKGSGSRVAIFDHAELNATLGKEAVTLGGGTFLPGLPDLTLFPSKVWNRLMDNAHNNAPSLIGDFDFHAGFPALRSELVSYLKMARGIAASPAQVFITAGVNQSLALISSCLRQAEDKAWVENPGYAVARNSLKNHGFIIEGVAIDSEGAVPKPDVMPPRLAYLTPSHQYPLGVGMSEARKQVWLDYAEKHNCWIVEDDYDGEFSYGVKPKPALASYRQQRNTLYLGTFSKVLSPSLRVNYLVVPDSLVDRFREKYPMLGNESAFATQASLAELLYSGHFSQHIKKVRELYHHRKQVLELALNAICDPDQMRMGNNMGGLHSCLYLNFDDREIFEQTSVEGLGCLALSQLYFEHNPDCGLLLGFTSKNEDVINIGVNKLERIINQKYKATALE